ncbi:mechanosensitive ion channel family protein [Anaerococcus sp. AGMB00486]|uniref:Mechanosensitive ion channel family protein n=2 Tax=Anaerococcus TaxID=165779 RepID=A0ABX2NCV3_9FIRM|nr:MULTISPECIES: mechanosensitive ion channel family protein [Anaerococcus]MDY3005562.1 mechanosensitive ion channel family protein [Anaerococcus porci]MSS78592.1 mechanosensitive ion channel family protein [Anaerococcus porci]NVF12529.1 mechanosensitive ion channel family protein [Anaerococcus faecalis]
MLKKTLEKFIENEIILDIVSILIVIIVAKIFLAILSSIIQKTLDSKKRISVLNSNKFETLSKSLHSFARFVVIFFAITMILNIIGINTRSILATAGIGGIAIAFGAQSIVQDFIKGMFIILDDTIRVGDWVKVAGIEGEVESVELRNTKIRDYDGSLHVIPNSQISSVKNYNRGFQKADAYFNVSYDTKIDEVMDLINTVSQKLLSDKEYKNYFIKKLQFFEINEFSELSYRIRVTSTVKAGSQWMVARKIRLLLKEEIEKRNVKASELDIKSGD